jgi:transglutaminase-like putative cysteine protease
LKIALDVGCYSIKTLVADPIYNSAPVTKQVIVQGTKFVAENGYAPTGHKVSYSVKLVNEKNKAVKNKKVVFIFKGKNSTVTTNSKGIAKVDLGVLSKGNYKIKFQHDSSKGSSKIFVLNKVTINNILKASKKVNKYVSKNSKLPSTVKVGDVSFKTADYLYLASKAIVNLKNGNKKSISIKILDNPTKPKGASNLGYLKDYLSVAKSIVKTAESKGKLPNSVSSKVGTIGYNGLVNTLSSVLTYYNSHKKMPSYISVTSLSGTSSSPTGVLNFKNSIKDLAPYLAVSKNCDVNDAKIKKLVTKLTKNCKTDKEKATVIYNYVRDTISYSFYYDTKFGAVGTLKAKTGNCVDHAHLAIAMFRSAGLAARYVHGTCHFSSGGTYGHVWAQVLIGNTWTVADATSTRNSLGKVVNWNTNSYTLKSYSPGILF